MSFVQQAVSVHFVSRMHAILMVQNCRSSLAGGCSADLRGHDSPSLQELLAETSGVVRCCLCVCVCVCVCLSLGEFLLGSKASAL